MRLYRLAFVLFFSIICLLGCSESTFEITSPSITGGVEVGFYAGGATTRTTIGEDGISTNWSADDIVSLWAVNSVGNTVLSNQSFGVYFRDLPASQAFFTTTLASAMTSDTYTYYATYPTPNSVSGTTATFTVPSTQDGKISGGAAILVATPTQAGALSTVTHLPGDYEVADPHLSLQMNHALHALRFYIPSTKWGFAEGENIERMEVYMPQAVAGDITLDYTNPSATPTTSNTKNNLILNLTTPFTASESAANINFVAASILPQTAFGDSDQMEVRTYSTTHASRNYISLAGRGAMAAGHITPVSVDCSEVVDRHYIRFIWNGNNLGEEVHTITFYTTAGNQIYSITNVSDFKNLGYHDVDFTFEDKSYLASVAGQDIVVKYESEHALVSNTITLPSDVATTTGCHEIGITVPYLFFEDFSLLNGFDFYGGNVSDTRKGSTTFNDTFFYPGWTGAQTTGKAGTALRIRTRNETTWAFYNGRVDSGPIAGLKDGASVKVRISFDYNATTEESGDNCMSFSYGYTTTQGPIEAYWWYKPLFGSQTGGYHIDNAITLSLPSSSIMASSKGEPFPSSYHSVNDFEINACTNKHRLSWEPLASGATNHLMNSKNHWLFIDNIKVQIVQ